MRRHTIAGARTARKRRRMARKRKAETPPVEAGKITYHIAFDKAEVAALCERLGKRPDELTPKDLVGVAMRVIGMTGAHGPIALPPAAMIPRNLARVVEKDALGLLLTGYQAQPDSKVIGGIMRGVHDLYHPRRFVEDFTGGVRGDYPEQGAMILPAYEQAARRLKKLLDRKDLLPQNREVIAEDIAHLEKRIKKGWAGDLILSARAPRAVSERQSIQYATILLYAYLTDLSERAVLKADAEGNDEQVRYLRRPGGRYSLITLLLNAVYPRMAPSTGKVKEHIDNKGKLERKHKLILNSLAERLNIPAPYPPQTT